MNDTWGAIIGRYEEFRQHEHWSELAKNMLLLINAIQADKTFPKTQHTISHAWLRVGPRCADPRYRPSVWVGWRKPNYYWMGIGSFGTRRRITVSAERAVPMLKLYLQHLHLIDAEYAPFHQGETPIEADEPLLPVWPEASLKAQYETLPLAQVLPTLTQTVMEQSEDLQAYTAQLRELLKGRDQLEIAENVLAELLKRAERINIVLTVALERYQIRQLETDPLS
ncbi:MAG: hypothetical protein MUF87_10020 [Anaerolineae bacterium]|nr:hypothetical protein [Anaerolineae bacterium]